uniref:Non-SMC condensin I complex, subunit G n=1 Tax=Nothobranchius furzeri TaxID=105023 RepID=A0A8C6K7Q7_NOTFU
MTADNEMSIKEAFQRAQKSHNNKAKLVASLKSRYNKLEDKTMFHEEFVHYLKYAMIVYKREPAVENVIEFVAKFSTSFQSPPKTEEEEEEEEDDEDDHPFLSFIFNFLLESHKANSHAVRFRVCQLINKLLGSMAENAQIDDDLFDRIHQAMLVRVTDKFPNVRIQAALAMARLQQPSDPDCPTISAYILILENDTNAEVRRAVLSCIAMSPQTLPKVFKRTRDIKENVRKLAYQVLADKVHIKALTIAQRVGLLQHGLHDTSEAIREVVCSRLLPAWLLLLDGNIIELLHRLDVENCAETAMETLKALFKGMSTEELLQNRAQLDNRKLIPVDSLTCENVVYWRVLCEFIKGKGNDGDEMLEQVLPDAATYAEYLRSYLKTVTDMSEEQRADYTQLEMGMTKEFISQQLIHLIESLDTNEEGGRKRVLAVLQEMLTLPQTPSSLVCLLTEKLLLIILDDQRRVQTVAEIISDVMEPITEVSQPVDENKSRRQQVQLAEVKVRIMEAKEALENCIAAQDFSQAAELKESITKLEDSRNQILQEISESNQPVIKEVRTEKNDPETLLRCLTMCAELLKKMNIKTPIGPTISCLSFSEGLAKLMYTGRISSAKMLSRLVLLWYNPITEDDTHLRHCLGVFFQLYARESRSHQEVVEESFLPTIRTLLEAPATSPLAEVDVNNVVELLVELTRPSTLTRNAQNADFTSVHDFLAVRMCGEMLKDPTAPEVRLYAKALSNLEFSRDDAVVKDHICLRALEKMLQQLTDSKEQTELLSASPPQPLDVNADGTKLLLASPYDGENVPETVSVVRPSRRAKTAALEKTKLDLNPLINQEANVS